MPDKTQGPCTNTDNGATNIHDQGCWLYDTFPGTMDTDNIAYFCGVYNDDDFIANEVCCVCGGIL